MLFSDTLQLSERILKGNAIWFIILTVIFVLLLIFTFWKKKDQKLVVLFFCMSGIAGFLENVIFFWLDCYEYYPHVWKEPYYDNTFGAYLSQRFFVSSVAVFIAAFNLGIGPILLLISMFIGIENLFLVLKLYKLNWWHPSYTAAGLFIYFYIGKVWFKHLLQIPSHIIRFITLFCTLYTLYTDIIAIPTLSGHYFFDVIWFDDPARNTIIVIILYCLIRSFFLAIVCCYRFHWIIMILVPAFMWLSYFVLFQMGIFSFRYSWNILLFAASDIMVLLSGYYFNKVLSKIEK